MPENKGIYQKYRVERVDGQPITGQTFTLEPQRDPFALAALKAYREAAAAAGTVPNLVNGLNGWIAALEGTGRPNVES